MGNAGRVYVFSGLDGSVLYSCDGTAASDNLGYAVGPAGDTNGAGMEDLIAGARYADPGGASNAGCALVISGRQLDLHSDYPAIPASTGGQVAFQLDAGPAYAGRSYAMLGSATGMSPGMATFWVHIPLNYDTLFSIRLMSGNSPVFQNFRGTLDGSGQASATLDTLIPVDPLLVGSNMWFAFVTMGPLDYASNALPVQILP